MARKLTLKQQRFIAEYLKDGNASRAAREAGYTTKTPEATRAVAWETLTNPNVQKAVEQALTKAEITPEYITLRLNQLSNTASKDSDKLRALENLAKIIELTGFKQSQNQGTTINGDITISFGKPQTQPYYIDNTSSDT